MGQAESQLQIGPGTIQLNSLAKLLERARKVTQGKKGLRQFKMTVAIFRVDLRQGFIFLLGQRILPGHSIVGAKDRMLFLRRQGGSIGLGALDVIQRRSLVTEVSIEARQAHVG